MHHSSGLPVARIELPTSATSRERHGLLRLRGHCPVEAAPGSLIRNVRKFRSATDAKQEPSVPKEDRS
jgi:hypothetical protein